MIYIVYFSRFPSYVIFYKILHQKMAFNGIMNMNVGGTKTTEALANRTEGTHRAGIQLHTLELL